MSPTIVTEENGRSYHKSSYSGSQGNCLQIAPLVDDTFAVRDSETPGVELTVSKASLKAFLDGAADGEFDFLVA
jgi:hypothetical protein